MMSLSLGKLQIEVDRKAVKSELWDILINGSSQDLQMFIEEVESDSELFTIRHEIFSSPRNGLTPLDYVDDEFQRKLIQAMLQIEPDQKRRRLN